jgi:exopolysaccharide production protein ExoQ
VTPALAIIAYSAVIALLFLLNRDRTVRTSTALWIPTVWVFIAGSRPPSLWFAAPDESAANSLIDGNPLERNIFTTLLILMAIVLISRGPKIGKLLQGSTPLLVFLFYCVVSLCWSDYPEVGFKRWTKFVGDLGMVAVVLTDRDPGAALDRLVTRTGFLIAPLSVLMVRYFPYIGRSYDVWSGTMHWTGITTNKNSLGLICMIIGLASLWRVLRELRNPLWRRRPGPLIANSVILAMVVYLLYEANSATSKSCFFLAGSIILALSVFRAARGPVVTHLLVAAAVGVSIAALFFNVGDLLHSLGRNSTLTGRTDLWDIVLSQPVSRLVGAGYEGFWLGDRLQTIWRLSGQPPNQAHNGYIEILVNLGWVGVSLLAVIIVMGYRKICEAVRQDPETNCLMLGFFVAAVIYNLTEAAFKMMDPVWIFFVWSIIAANRATKMTSALPNVSHGGALQSTMEIDSHASVTELWNGVSEAVLPTEQYRF